MGRIGRGAVLLCVVGLGAGLWLWLHRDSANPGKLAPASRQEGANPAGKVPFSEPEARQGLRAAAAALKYRINRQDSQKILDGLRESFSKLPTEATVAILRDFLDGGADGPTQLEFAVGLDGLLTGAPTLRVFLLDQLARVDRAAAAAYARQILERMDSPDEWAVALRNLALGAASAEVRALLREKAGQMLKHEPWQRNPSVGYLEAFDVAVHLGGTGLVPTLAGLVQLKDNPAVAHAAHLALDRMVIQEPAATLNLLQAEPGLLAGRELARADLFARADVRNAPQRQAVENYLLSAQRSAAELNQFAGVFPNASFRISQNLLTRSLTPDFATLAARDAGALQAVNEWLADPRFAQLKPQLEKIRRRLENFVRQAGGRE